MRYRCRVVHSCIQRPSSTARSTLRSKKLRSRISTGARGIAGVRGTRVFPADHSLQRPRHATESGLAQIHECTTRHRAFDCCSSHALRLSLLQPHASTVARTLEKSAGSSSTSIAPSEEVAQRAMRTGYLRTDAASLEYAYELLQCIEAGEVQGAVFQFNANAPYG